MEHHLYIGLGSNLGNRENLIREALRLIELNIGSIARTSRFIETKPLGFQSEHLFFNAAALVVTTLTPHQCLAVTQHIERMLGRKQKSLLLYDDVHINDNELTLPHPRIEEREFVSIPLKEILQ